MGEGSNITRRRQRGFWRGLAAALLLVLIAPPLYVAWTPDRRPALALPAPERGTTYAVYVADWGYHTSVVVQQPAGWRLGPPGEEEAPFLEYAWGDRRFYLLSDYRPHAVFATVFLPTASVLYLDGRTVPPRPAAARTVSARRVTAETVRVLLSELERSIRRTAAGGRLPPYPPAPGYPGRFYPAHGAYLWSNDCNRWTVERLRAAGLAGRGTGVVFSGQVQGRLRGFGPYPAGAVSSP